MQTSSTKIQILQTAKELIQTRGYHAFSYADTSKSVGIRKASIHHHFLSKADLGAAVVAEYREIFNLKLQEFATEKNWKKKIQLYFKLYEHVIATNKLCLCGMLASDTETLPPIIQTEIQCFFDDNLAWLDHFLKTYFKEISKKHRKEIVWHMISSLHGGAIMTRMHSSIDVFYATTHILLALLEKIQ